MTVGEAKKIGSGKALKTLCVLLAVIFVILLLQETKGDFANGILFFIQYLLNGYVWVIIFLLFGLTWLLGGLAGEVIICKKWNFVLVANTVAVVIWLIIISYMAFAGALNNGASGTANFLRQAGTYFLVPLKQVGLPLLGALVVSWLWAAYRMWLIAGREKESDVQ
jgi:hypothetical protein